MVIKTIDETGKIYYRFFDDYNIYMRELEKLSENETSKENN